MQVTAVKMPLSECATAGKMTPLKIKTTEQWSCNDQYINQLVVNY